MNPWSKVRDGTAIGPTAAFETACGQAVEVTALWSDEEGVGVTAVIPPDAFYSAELSRRIMAATEDLLKTPPPPVVAYERSVSL